MPIPTPHTLGVRRWSAGTRGAHGNAADVYADPVPWKVYGIAPGSMDEPPEANRDLSVVVFTIYAPVSDRVPTERDRVVYDGVEYEVNGRPKDFSRGPWGAIGGAGVTVELKRAEG